MDDAVSQLEKINKNGTQNGVCETKDDFTRRESQTALRRQIFICFGTFFITLGTGATSGYSAILIPQIQHRKGKHISVEMISWLASISSFALIFGNILSGYLMDRFGRRMSQLMCSAFFVIGWMIIGFSQDMLFLILVGRFITGICQGWLGPLGSVFVGEITAPVYRGFFLGGLSVGIAAGVFMSHLFGTILHYSYASMLCGLFPLIGGIIVYQAPESPVWFASKSRIDDCIASFQWYRGTSSEMKMELDKMIAEQTKQDKTNGKLQSLKMNIQKPEFYKPLFLMAVFFIVTQLCGVNVICAYTTDMMNVLIGGHTNNNAYVAMLSIDVLRCASLCLACFLFRKLGRRPLAIFSGIFTSLSLILLALYLYLVDIGTFERVIPFISLGLMAIYIIVSNLGISPLPWNMVGELFATETKGIGSGISVMMTSIAFFATIKTAPAMFDSIGHHGAYMFYGISTLLGTIFLFFYLPETKGKTLLQVAEHFRYGKKGVPKEEVKLNKLDV